MNRMVHRSVYLHHNMETKMKRSEGVSLFEMLLVIVIATAIILLSIDFLNQKTLNTQINMVTSKYQEVEHAALAYYANNNAWPGTPDVSDTSGITCLEGTAGSSPSTMCQIPYLQPAQTSNPLFNMSITTAWSVSMTPPVFYINMSMSSGGSTELIAQTVSGRLPNSYYQCSSTTNCTITSVIVAPPQNLNDAGAVTFAGVYQNGACVPAPNCPPDNNGHPMIAEIMLAPVAMSGINDPNNPNQVYPITSFTAYATGGTNNAPPACNNDSGVASLSICYADANSGNGVPNGAYWRACLQVQTQKGIVSWGNPNPPYNAGPPPSNSGYYSAIVAVTRCVSKSERKGSGFGVFAP